MHTATAAEQDAAGDEDKLEPVSAELGKFCFFAGTPPEGTEYVKMRELKVKKGSYGGVKDILPILAQKGQRIEADAVINYAGSQRFGFFPWKVVRPVVRGMAIKWISPRPFDCAAQGGMTLSTILATDQAPQKIQPAPAPSAAATATATAKENP